MIGVLHRRVWQRLPYGLRRAALFRATSLAAPRPAPNARAAAPVVVAGAFRAASGLGQSALLCLEALREAGVPARALDLTEALRQPAVLPAPADPGAIPDGPGTVILHVNAPLTGMALLGAGRARMRGKRIIGYWAWELPEVPPEWRLGVPLVHEVWAPSEFTAAALRPIAGGRPVQVVPHPVALGPAPTRPPRDPARPFTVLAMFDAASSLSRKNPEGMVEAFRRAFGDDPGARLILKTQRLDAAPEMAPRLRALTTAPNVALLDATLDRAALDALYARADVLLSLHRAEGFGLAIAEAMRRGLPAVATGWSGNADFLDGTVGMPVPWRLVPAEDPQRTYHHPRLAWAEPDLDVAAAALRRLRAEPALREALGTAAAARAEALWSAAAYRARLATLGLPVA